MKLGVIKPFVPSGQDFALARDFFKRLGFNENCFLLQKYHNQEMQDNLMLSVVVDDLEAYWTLIQESGVLSMVGVSAKPPTDFPWGQREIHLIDPAGVFCHIVQATAD